VKARSLLDSFNYAFEGILYAFKTQRNIRLHFVATVLVLLSSLIFKINKLEFLMLMVAIAFVVMAEMINTAIEASIDLFTQEYHFRAAIAKNVAAGAVLVSSGVALVVGFLIFFPKFDPTIPRVLTSLQKSPSYLTLVALLLTILAVIVGKALSKTGRPLQGGMPSGHAALSTVAATTIAFLSSNGLITVLAFLLVLLVAESRVENRIHSFVEVLAGILVGFLMTVLVFQLLVF